MGKVTAKQWAEIVETFDSRCAFCLDRLAANEVTQDHFRPVTKGGEHALDNLVPCCQSCNSSKGNALMFDWVPRLVG